jgi:hypothetical protein
LAHVDPISQRLRHEQDDLVTLIVEQALWEYEKRRGKPGLDEEVNRKGTAVSFSLVMLQAATLIKHPAFSEEKEWRLVATHLESPLQFRLTRTMLVPYKVFPLMLARAIKARWVCEQAHQQMKEELGLDHYEGRSWRGLHHHALLSMIAFTFLQQWRLTQQRGGKKTSAPTWPSAGRPAAPAHAAGGTARAARGHPHRAPPLSAVPRSAPAAAA